MTSDAMNPRGKRRAQPGPGGLAAQLWLAKRLVAAPALAVGGLLAGSGSALAELPARCVASTYAITCTYVSDDRFAVPTDVSMLHVVAVGGIGAAGAADAPGGHGQRVEGEIPFPDHPPDLTGPKRYVAVEVGGNAVGSAGGAHGGGDGSCGGGGGGASTVVPGVRAATRQVPLPGPSTQPAHRR